MVVITDLIKRPLVMAGLALLAGLGLGLLFAWVVWPVQFVDATPAYLRADLQEDYLRMTIDSLRVNGDPNLAVRRWQDLGPNGPVLLEIVKADPKAEDPQVVQAFSQLVAQYPPTGEAQQPSAEEPAGNLLTRLVLPVGGILVLMVLIIGGLFFMRGLLANRMGREPSAGMQAAEINRQTERTNFEDLGLAPPITQTMTTYLLGDDLYCHQPFCEAVRQQQMDFLFVCKPDSHALLYEWVDDFTRTGEVQVLEKSRWNGKQRLTERYRYINQVPLRDSDDALLVNWCEVTEGVQEAERKWSGVRRPPGSRRGRVF